MKDISAGGGREGFVPGYNISLGGPALEHRFSSQIYVAHNPSYMSNFKCQPVIISIQWTAPYTTSINATSDNLTVMWGPTRGPGTPVLEPLMLRFQDYNCGFCFHCLPWHIFVSVSRLSFLFIFSSPPSLLNLFFFVISYFRALIGASEPVENEEGRGCCCCCCPVHENGYKIVTRLFQPAMRSAMLPTLDRASVIVWAAKA